MSGRNKFKMLTDNWSDERKQQVAQKTDALDAELLLSELRESLGISQQKLSEILACSQPAVAQMEKRTDMTVSTLRRVVEGLGGSLTLTANFPEQRVKLMGFDPGGS